MTTKSKNICFLDFKKAVFTIHCVFENAIFCSPIIHKIERLSRRPHQACFRTSFGGINWTEYTREHEFV